MSTYAKASKSPVNGQRRHWSDLGMSVRIHMVIRSVVASYVIKLALFFMPPTSKKLEGHIASGLFVRPSVLPSVRPSVRHAF